GRCRTGARGRPGIRLTPRSRRRRHRLRVADSAQRGGPSLGQAVPPWRRVRAASAGAAAAAPVLSSGHRARPMGLPVCPGSQLFGNLIPDPALRLLPSRQSGPQPVSPTLRRPTMSGLDTALTPLRFLERSLEAHPEREAIIDGPRRFTYRQMADTVQRLAEGLKRRGLSEGDTVAVLAPNSAEALIAHYAVPLAGGVLVMLNTRL